MHHRVTTQPPPPPTPAKTITDFEFRNFCFLKKNLYVFLVMQPLY